MKLSLTLSILLTLFAGGVVSQVPDDVHEKCKDARDYVGCIQVLTGATVSKEEAEIEEIKNLKKALALLPSRLENTSLRDFSMAIQPFTDALASARAVIEAGSDYSLEDKTKIVTLTNPSLRLSASIDIFRSTWRSGIDHDVAASPSVIGHKFISCFTYDFYIDGFNSMYESNVLNYQHIFARAFDAGCYLNNESGRPMYREYEGQMLYYIIDASKEILKAGSFPTYPFPYESLDKIKADYIEHIQIETRDDIAKYKKLHELENNPWVESEDLNNFSKRDFRRAINIINKFISTRAINNNAIVCVGCISDKGPKLNAIIAAKENIHKFYNYDFATAVKNGNRFNIDKIFVLSIFSNSLGEELINTIHGNKKNNLKEARELFISTLAFDIENCLACYDSGRPNASFNAIYVQRNVAHKKLKKIDNLLSASNSQPP